VLVYQIAKVMGLFSAGTMQLRRNKSPALAQILATEICDGSHWRMVCLG
jgi:hypothetical protein